MFDKKLGHDRQLDLIVHKLDEAGAAAEFASTVVAGAGGGAGGGPGTAGSASGGGAAVVGQSSTAPGNKIQGAGSGGGQCTSHMIILFHNQNHIL